MDRPPVCQLCRQVHRWVSASGMDKRWKHLSAKPSARLELLMRVVVDYDVDRVQVYSRWRHSRALLIARNFCHPDVLPPLLWVWSMSWPIFHLYGSVTCLVFRSVLPRSFRCALPAAGHACSVWSCPCFFLSLSYGSVCLFVVWNTRHIQVVIASGFHLFPFRTEKLSPIAPMVLQCNVGE